MKKNYMFFALLTVLSSVSMARTVNAEGSGYCQGSAACAQNKAYNRAVEACLSAGGMPTDSVWYTGGCSTWGEMIYGYTTDCSYKAFVRCEL